MAFQRGLDDKHEQAQKYIMRDTRPISVRLGEFFRQPFNTAIFLLIMLFSGFYFPLLAEFSFLVSCGVYIFCISQRLKLPFRMPKFSKQMDYNDYQPGSKKKAQLARGIYHFGNEKTTNEEIWFNDEDMRTHVLVFGSTGSGKTQLLISLAYNALCQASGFIYVDGKGDNSLFSSIFSMVRSMGREIGRAHV